MQQSKSEWRSLTNIGIVGLGKMGILHAGILNALQDTSVAAVCEKEGLLRRAAKKLIPNISFYDNVLEMVERSNLDGVYVTTPIVSHLSIVDDLAKSNRKIALFIEKPLAGNLEDAKEILAKASSLGSVNMVGFQKRFSPQFQRVKQLLENKALGDLFFFRGYSFVSGVFSKGSGWRFSKGQGGSLLDLGSHLIDLLLWYFGEPSYLSAAERSLYSEEVEDFSHVIFNFKSGLIGHVDVSWSAQGYRLPETQLEIQGANGTLVVNDDALKFTINKDVPNVISAGSHNLKRPEFTPGVDFLLGDPEYCLEDKYFIECVKIGKVPDPGLDAGLNVNKIAKSIHSFKKGEDVLN